MVGSPVRALSDAITLGMLQTPMDSATVLEPRTSARAAVRLLSGMNFDQAPVVENGHPVGYATLEDLRGRRSGPVARVVRPILPNALASESATLESALPRLAETGFLFLLSGHAISGFVVPSDLNKQAGRSYFYLGLAALELALADYVRALVAGGRDVLADLTRDAQKVRSRHRKSTAANVEADLVAAMDLPHLLQIAAAPGHLLNQLGIASEQWGEYCAPVSALRNRVAHLTTLALERPDDLPKVVEIDYRVHQVLAAVGLVANGSGVARDDTQVLFGDG